MSFLATLVQFGALSIARSSVRKALTIPSKRRSISSSVLVSCSQLAHEQVLTVVGCGAAGVFASIRAKELAPDLKLLVIEKGKPLSKVKISGGGRCNVTNGNFLDKMMLAENYPRGHKELRGLFFDTHGPSDTIRWFEDRGVKLKIEQDGRVFPVTDDSSTILDCLLQEARQMGVIIQLGKVATGATCNENGKLLLKLEKRTADLVEYVESNYLLIASGSSQQGYKIATELGHSIVDPVPSLFTFKVNDLKLLNLSGLTFPKVKVKLKLENLKDILQLTQVGPMLVTHWGLSGPVILRLSAWAARQLYLSNYRGILLVDFVPDIHVENMKHILFQHKNQFARQKANNSFPVQFDLAKSFWRFLLENEGLNGDDTWATLSSASLNSIARILKQFPLEITGKGQFKDEFVTAGGVPISEVSLNTMESRLQPNLFFAGEVLNVDGVTGGFNFQNAWSGGYIAGTTIGIRASNIEAI